MIRLTKGPFKVTVSLAAQPRPKEWSLLAAAAQVMKPIAAPAAAKGQSER
jgi:hypothetical protein